MQALAELRNLPFRKSEQEQFAEMAVTEILSGEIDPLAADLRLKAMEEVIKRIREDRRVKSAVIEEAEKYGKVATVEGVRIEIKSRTTRDYSGCGDEVYNQLTHDAENLKQQIKAREMMLSSGANPETGETYQPPKSSTTTYLSYSF